MSLIVSAIVISLKHCFVWSPVQRKCKSKPRRSCGRCARRSPYALNCLHCSAFIQPARKFLHRVGSTLSVKHDAARESVMLSLILSSPKSLWQCVFLSLKIRFPKWWFREQGSASWPGPAHCSTFFFWEACVPITCPWKPSILHMTNSPGRVMMQNQWSSHVVGL